MHVPIQVDYGVRALVDLTARDTQSAERASDIAQRQNIPNAYLARVLNILHHQGFIKSQRGPKGGHSLAKNPSEITMGDVMDTLGGGYPIVTCLNDVGSCVQAHNCTQREVWREAELAMRKVLDSTTIADLVPKRSGNN